MDTKVATPLQDGDLQDRANSAIHAVGAGAAMAGTGLLAVLAAHTGDPWKIAATALYGATLILLFLSSTLYHSARTLERRRLLRAIDHAAIPMLIAGTYTPFLLVNLRGSTGWWMFGTIWTLGLSSLALGILAHGKFKLARTLLFLAMGWLIVLALPPLVATLGTTSLVLLVAGGVAYSVGTIFYMLDKRLPFGHALWHLFVLGASVCHFLSIVYGVLPYPR
jgi:hemolysin III